MNANAHADVRDTTPHDRRQLINDAAGGWVEGALGADGRREGEEVGSGAVAMRYAVKRW